MRDPGSFETNPAIHSVATGRSTRIDVCAVTLSSLCIIHCLALPLFAALLPLNMVWIENEWVHRVFVLIALPISGIAIYSSLTAREGPAFSFAAIVGLSLLLMAAFIEALHDFEVVMTVIGALMLAAAHLGRWIQRGHRARRAISSSNETP